MKQQQQQQPSSTNEEKKAAAAVARNEQVWRTEKATDKTGNGSWFDSDEARSISGLFQFPIIKLITCLLFFDRKFQNGRVSLCVFFGLSQLCLVSDLNWRSFDFFVAAVFDRLSNFRDSGFQD